MLRNDKFCISRLGPVPQSKVDNTLLQGVCSAVFCNDISAARTLLHESSSECFFNRRVSTPFGGHRVFPIECIVESAATEEEKAELAEYLHDHGASMNIAWRDTTGEHTPLSKALSLRQFRLAAALVACGASPSTALLETSLLENTKFDPRVARWLLDMGADVTVPAHHSPRACLGSAGSISAVVTVLGKAGVELQVMRHLASLHALPSSTQRQQEQRLLRRVAYVLTLLTAAGAPPARPPPAASALAAAQAGTAADGMLPPGLALHPQQQQQLEPPPPQQQGAHAAVPPAAAALVSHLTLGEGERKGDEDRELDSAFGSPSSQRPRDAREEPAPLPFLEQLRLGPGPSSPARARLAAVPSPALFGLSPQDWEFLCPYATQALQWSPELNFLFPAPLRKAIREVVLISCCRGFGVGSSSGSAAAAAAPASGAGQVQQEQEQAQEREQQCCSSREPGTGTSLGNEPCISSSQQSQQQQQQHPGFGEPRPQPSAQRRAGSSPRAPASQAAAAASAATLWWRQGQPQAGVVWLDGNVVESIILALAKVWSQRA